MAAQMVYFYLHCNGLVQTAQSADQGQPEQSAALQFIDLHSSHCYIDQDCVFTSSSDPAKIFLSRDSQWHHAVADLYSKYSYIMYRN